MFSALHFSSTQVVDFGSPTILDNIFMSRGTAMLYAWRDTWTGFTGGNLLRKNAGNSFQFSWGAGATPDIQILLDRATTDLRIASTATAMPLIGAQKWVMMAAVWDTAAVASTDQRLFCGDLNNPFVEATSYTTQQTGTGSVTDTTALPLLCGNVTGGGTPEPGNIGLLVVWDRVLTLNELRQNQYNPSPRGTSLFSWLGKNGRGIAIDESGNNMHGAVTAIPNNIYMPRTGLNRAA